MPVIQDRAGSAWSVPGTVNVSAYPFPFLISLPAFIIFNFLFLTVLFITGCSPGTEVTGGAAGSVLHVRSDASGTGDGSSWEQALAHPQEALDRAGSGDQIWVAGGSYGPRTPLDEMVISLKEGVRILGGFRGLETAVDQRDPYGAETILDGGSQVYHVVVGAKGAVIDGFTITGGHAHGTGTDAAGGGMINIAVSPTVRRCLFRNNSAAYLGGAVYNEGGSPVFEDCVFEDNEATYGGAMDNYHSSAYVINGRFRGNVSLQNGGGVSDYFSSTRFINCVFSGNRTTFSGGAMFSYSSSPFLSNCSLTGNRSEQNGGALGSLNSAPTLVNSILWNNDATNDTELSSTGSEVKITYSIIRGGHPGDANLDLDPRFVQEGRWESGEWIEGDYRLTAGSPGIDSGVEGYSANFDIEDNPRPQLLSYDRGAYEYVPIE